MKIFRRCPSLQNAISSHSMLFPSSRIKPRFRHCKNILSLLIFGGILVDWVVIRSRMASMQAERWRRRRDRIQEVNKWGQSLSCPPNFLELHACIRFLSFYLFLATCTWSQELQVWQPGTLDEDIYESYDSLSFVYPGTAWCSARSWPCSTPPWFRQESRTSTLPAQGPCWAASGSMQVGGQMFPTILFQDKKRFTNLGCESLGWRCGHLHFKGGGGKACRGNTKAQGKLFYLLFGGK